MANGQDAYTWKVRERDVVAAERVLNRQGVSAGEYREALSTILSFAEELGA